MLYEILGSKNKEKLLKYLITHPKVWFTLSELANATSISVSQVKSIVDLLNEKNILIKANRKYNLNSKSFIIQNLKEILYLEVTIKKIKKTLLSKFKEYEVSIIHFGSTSVHKNTERSDIDLLILCKNKNLAKISEISSELNETLFEKYGVVLEILTIDAYSWKRLQSRNDPFYMSIVSEGIFWKDDLKVRG